MCLQTTLLIVLTSTCAITGNVARSKKCVVYFDSPIEDVPTTGHRPHAIVACPAPWASSYQCIFVQKNSVFVLERAHARVLTRAYSYHIGMCTGSAQTVTTAKSGVSFAWAWFRYHLDSTIDGSVELMVSSFHTHSPFAVFSPQSGDELKGAVDTCVKVSDCSTGTQIDWQIGVSHVTVMNKMLRARAILLSVHFSEKHWARSQRRLLLFQMCVYFAMRFCTVHGTRYWQVSYHLHITLS